MAQDADQIAARAMQQIGTPFKLHGRMPGAALDCVGLAAHAVGPDRALAAVPRGYRAKGDYFHQINSYLEHFGFTELLDRDDIQPGDIIMARPGPQQQHLMIRTEQGYVHAHAGLRRVVLTPGPSPWPVIAGWRLSGG